MSTMFASRISGLRKERGLSQKKVAADLGISSALLSHYENGIRECGLDFVRKISGYYNVSSDYILGLTEERGKESEGGTTLEALHYTACFLDEKLKELQDDSMRENLESLFMLTVYRALSLCMANDGETFRYAPVTADFLTEAIMAQLRKTPAEQIPNVLKDEIPPCVSETVEKAEEYVEKMSKKILEKI